MSLVKVNELLQHATKHHYGVPAINVMNYETIRYAIEAAEEEKLPIIVQFFPGLIDYFPAEYACHIAVDMAKKASVPVAVHLDHSRGFEIAVSGIKDGYPSVMVDGSAFPFEENVQMTSEVVRVAKVYGVDVEAELGHVGDASNLEDFVNADLYTNVAEAVEFVERTGCGSLAVAVGNAHGNYVRTPELSFDRIKELRDALNVPLVMHGGSGIPDAQLQKAVMLGMSKFNIATDYFASMYRGFEAAVEKTNHNGDGDALLRASREAMVNFVRGKLRLLNPDNFTL